MLQLIMFCNHFLSASHPYVRNCLHFDLIFWLYFGQERALSVIEQFSASLFWQDDYATEEDGYHSILVGKLKHIIP